MKTQTLLLTALVVLAAAGLYMQYSHHRQRERAARYATIQTDIATHHMRIASLCTEGEQAQYENATAETQEFVVKTFKEVAPSPATPGDVFALWRGHIGCALEYRALIDDKAAAARYAKKSGGAQ
jgi:hypothetical protein